MANKRMFTMKICDSDAFLDMPLTAQCLYFHLNMRADDDGFIGNPNKISRLIGASKDDLEILIAKRFLLLFDDGVIVIKHWRMHNSLSKNRYHETVYLDEKSMLLLKDNGAYSFNSGDSLNDTRLIEQSDRQVRRNIDATKTQQRRTVDEQKTDSDLDLDIDKKKTLSKERVKEKVATQHFSAPTLEEVQVYAKSISATADAELFFDYYQARDWKGIKDWKASFRVWEKREQQKAREAPESSPAIKKSMFKEFAQREYDFNELEEKLINRSG